MAFAYHAPRGQSAVLPKSCPHCGGKVSPSRTGVREGAVALVRTCDTCDHEGVRHFLRDRFLPETWITDATPDR